MTILSITAKGWVAILFVAILVFFGARATLYGHLMVKQGRKKNPGITFAKLLTKANDGQVDPAVDRHYRRWRRSVFMGVWCSLAGALATNILDLN